MDDQDGACEECTRTCLLIHGRRDPDPSPVVRSFFKVVIDKSFKRVLYIPPAFARLVSHLANKETYLEDSSGQKWEVQISDRNGALAIRQGWHKFSLEHGVEIGDFLVFHYIQGEHFIVQIFGRSGCQKIRFNNDNRKGKKSVRTNSKETSQDELLAETDINARKKQKPTPSVTAAPESERAEHQPVTSTFASNIDADTGKRRRVPQGKGTSDAVQGENGTPIHVSTNSRLPRESSPIDGVPAEMELVTSETPLQFFDVAVQIENISEPVNGVDVSYLGKKDENGQTMGLISSTCLQSAENGGSHMELLYDKEIHYTNRNQVTRETTNEASQFGKESYIVEKDGPSAMAVSGCNKVTKSEPGDSGETSFPDAGSFSYTLQVDGKNGLLLPQCWPVILMRKEKKLGRGLVKLQGPDKRIWWVMYHERPNFKCLGGCWPFFTQVYGLKPGDECVFQLVDRLERMFSVQVAQKVEVTLTSLSDE